MMKRDTTIHEFRVFFKDYLRINYPAVADDTDVIDSRVEAARKVYRRYPHDTEENRLYAADMAFEALIDGFAFSRYDFIYHVLYCNFIECSVLGNVDELALAMVPECNDVFDRYELTAEMMIKNNERLTAEIVQRIDDVLSRE